MMDFMPGEAVLRTQENGGRTCSEVRDEAERREEDVREDDRAAAKRAMNAMMTMRKIDIAAIEAARAKQ